METRTVTVKHVVIWMVAAIATLLCTPMLLFWTIIDLFTGQGQTFDFLRDLWSGDLWL